MQPFARVAALLAFVTCSPILASGDSTVIPKIDPSVLKANVAELSSDAMNGRSFRSEDGKRAAEWVAKKLAEAGAKPLVKDKDGHDTMLVPLGRLKDASPHVVAWLPPAGPKPSGEFIVVSSHYDHLPPKSSGDDRIYNGADDNASGTCGVIAVANALRDDKLNVGVVFVAFTGEEAGLIGSRAFIEEETVPVARIRGNFNMDMISRQPDNAIRLDGGPKGKVLVDLLVRLAPEADLKMQVDTHPDWLDRSDQGAFLSAGIPAVLFSCEDHEDYHKVSDTVDKIDPVLAAKTAALVAGATRTFAQEMSPRFDLAPIAVDALESGSRTLRIGRPAANPPYWRPATRRDQNRGLDKDVWTELAKRLGWKLEEKTISASAEEKPLRDGEVDVIADGFRSSPARAQEFALTGAYFGGSGIAALTKAGAGITDASKLAGKKVAVAAGSAE